jgi:prepilin signal peptidase PulO-like enzyme (type II secretory pathway)
MQYAYIFAVLSYQVAFSNTGTDKLTIESMQKVAVIMLAYAIGKYFTIYPFSKYQKTASRLMMLYITGGVCLVNIIAQFLIVFLSLKKYNAGWFIVAFVFGLQDAVLSCKQETDVINITTEIEETNLDSCVLGKLIGALLIFLLGSAFKTNTPQVLLGILSVILLASCGISFIRVKREAEPIKSMPVLKEGLIEEQTSNDDKVDILDDKSGKGL